MKKKTKKIIIVSGIIIAISVITIVVLWNMNPSPLCRYELFFNMDTANNLGCRI